MDSDVEMVPPPECLSSPGHSVSSPHVSPAPSHSRSILDNLDVYGSPSKNVLGNHNDDQDNDPADTNDPPPTTNEDDPDAPGDVPGSPTDKHDEEHDSDATDTDDSSDNASEDDVDKDLVRDADVTDAESARGQSLRAARWDEADPGPHTVKVEGAESTGANGGIRIPVLVDPTPRSPAAAAVRTAPTSPISAQPPSSVPKPAKKPKSHHATVPPPPLPPPPPPMQTIRLDIELGGPDNYEVDVKQKARDEGIHWGDLVAKKYADDSSDGEDGSDGEEKDGKDADGDVNMDADGNLTFSQKPKSKRKKKSKKSKAVAEYYDTADPFIDDSELAIDERTYFAQTKQKGFYVSSGEVALVRDKAPKKPKSKKKPALSLNLPVASTSALKPSSSSSVLKKTKSTSATSVPPPSSKIMALGTKDSPIPLEDEDEDTKANIFASQQSVKGKGKVKDDPDEATAIADGVNRMTGKWKERVSVNGGSASPVANGDHHEGSLDGGGDDGEGDGDDEVGRKRKRPANGSGDGARKRKPVDIANFHPDLQIGIEKMKQAIAAESWETKSKFPPSLKPLLAQLSLQAISLDEYNEQFFNLMPMIFPYNKFTMSKLIKRTIFHEHTTLLNRKQDELLKHLHELASEGFPKAQEEWERSVQSYEEKRKEKAAREGDPEVNPDESTGGPTRHGTEDPEARGSADGGGDKEKEKEGGPGKGGAHPGPPLKKYRMTEAMKAIVWQLVLLSNEICRLENEKNSLEGSVLQVSEQGLRKVLYQRIVSAFPDGWMSSGQISRDVSAMKKKLEKEAQDD
ncbi:hypothetical protein GGX14DRAFT_464457 [Mycena pura]|uniref:Ubinuclein middle domain-containing protein n=1 Tax=Mycena pura TaxID=153505 RepID=A0AAD6V5T8_9AGAR|nr:hypothetical protein GGX14DRAFT_464457 [Mycena pura]